MKKYCLLVLVLMVSFVRLGIAQESTKTSLEYVQPGEVLTYKISYGFLSIGEARIETSSTMHALNNIPCYKLDITGKTTGAVGWVAKVDDKWGSYLNAKTLLPVKNYRSVRENNYKRDELTYFDHQKKNIRYFRYDHQAGKYQDAERFAFTETVRDLIGGYHYLRQLDYNAMAMGDTINLFGFFENEFYSFRILYKGKEILKTPFGKVGAIKLVPIMPDNKVFDGENSISLWLSDDSNRIPLKAEANMFIGRAVIEISKYENLKKSLVIANSK
jgi:hypothetical protein